MENKILPNRIIIISVLSLFIFPSCKKEAIDTSRFEGTWINERTLSDTIVVTSVSTFMLNRGQRTMVEGYVLPDYGAGIYSYTLDADKIFLNWLLSSDSSPKAYPFDLTNGRLSIGNFYEPAPQSEPVVTFRKIR